MNIFRFTAEFDSEDSCRNHFKEERDKIGVICRKCSNTAHYWIKSQWSYECKSCRSRTSLRSGTVMQSSKLSFLIWYKIMFLLTTTKKGFSSKEIQRQLGLKRYEPVWAMVHKLRKAMGSRDDRYTLEGMIEMDEGYFTIEASENAHKIKKTGRDTPTIKKTLAFIARVFFSFTYTFVYQSQTKYYERKTNLFPNTKCNICLFYWVCSSLGVLKLYTFIFF